MASKGQLSKYKPEYCQKLIEHMAKGKSFTHFATKIKVNKDTLWEWAKVHPAFSDAKKTAFEACQAWWEDQGQEGLWETTEYNDEGKPLKTRKLNTTSWIYNMKCRFRSEWHIEDKPTINIESNSVTEEVKKHLENIKNSDAK